MTLQGEPDLRAQVTSGVFWSGAGRVAQQTIQFALSVVLARLLSPNDYGLMAMVIVFIGFAEMLANAGFNTALVQKQDMAETHVHTVFWVTLMAGGLLAGVTFLVAPWLAVFYHTPALTPMFQAIAITFIFGALGNVPSALLQKRMQFRTLAKINTTSMLSSGIVGVVLAWRGAGVWSLVTRFILDALMSSLLRCWYCKWLPKPVFSLAALKDMWGFTGHLYAFNFINYWARNSDNLMVGKFFGASALGAYDRAYALMLLPISQINGVVSQVVFPAFASIQDDKERVKRIYLRAIGIVTLLAFPTMTGLFVVAEPFVLTVYGAKWREVTVLLQILALVGAMQVLTNSTGWLFMSQGRTDQMFVLGSYFAITFIASFAIGIAFGSVRALAICYAIANGLLFYPGMAVAGRVINMKFRELIAVVAGPFIASLIMAGAVASVHPALPSTWPAWQILVVLVATGMSFYSATVYLLRLSAWEELVQIIRKKHDG